MKIGKQPKRAGPASDKFLSKTRPEILTIPLDGPARIYVDTSRPCPEGWTVMRTPEEFLKLLDSDTGVLEQITHLSFDTSFGPRSLNGFQVMNRLADYFAMNENFMPNLIAIGLHGISRTQCQQMDKVLAAVLTPMRRNTLFVQWGTPRLDWSKPPKGFNHAKRPVRYVDRTYKGPEGG
jgi:hypothetical protein